MTRTEKWRYRRVQLDAEKQILQTMLLDASEKLMKIHSDMSNGLLTKAIYINENLLDRQMDEPLAKLDELMESLKEKKRFL